MPLSGNKKQQMLLCFISKILLSYDSNANPFSQFTQWRDKGLLRYVDKEKTRQVASRSKLQLSGRLLQPTGLGKILTEKNLAGYCKSNQPSNTTRNSTAAAQQPKVDTAKFQTVLIML